MNAELEQCRKHNLNLQNLLFEAYLFHLENCEEITPVPDRYIMDGYDEYTATLQSRWIPEHTETLNRINILRQGRSQSN